MSRRFFANFGAEEKDAPPPPALPPVLEHLQRAWASLFDDGGAFSDVDGDAFVAWLNTEVAVRRAAREGRPLFGSDPRVVALVHDKGFCVDVVRRHGLLDRRYDALVSVLDPAALVVERVRAAASFPAGWRSTPGHPPSFTLKPRRGTSGRGRVDSRNDVQLERALPRLRALGGAVVEPWLLRRGDFASQWRIHADGRIALLGASGSDITPGGLWRSSDVVVDEDGSVRAVDAAGRPFAREREFVEGSYLVVEAARDAGYVGPCGVDGFLFVDHEQDDRLLLRIVELNARFTAGMVAVCLARRLPPGSRARFAPSTSAALTLLPPAP